MACGATLKRSYDFDPIHSPHNSPKRRRCTPMSLGPSTPPAKSHDSPFGEVSPRLTPERIYAHIGNEYRRLQKRRQLYPQGGSSAGASHNELSLSPPPQHGLQSPHSSHPTVLPNALSVSPSKQDVPLFSIRQVGIICERLLKEREKTIGEQYDTILQDKLAEQYEAFLKFNHDMLHRRYNNAESSYVS